GASKISGIGDVFNLFMLFAPVAFVTLAEHIADHKNLSSIINRDLITDPGLDRTLIGDGVGSIVGSLFGGCPNTTYGESVGCVAITGNASVSTIFITAIYCIVLSFFDPFVAFVNSIPTCIVGGVCIALYGFIAVSGLKMVQNVDLGDNRNLFVVAAILVCGIGGLQLNFGPITISAIATALIAGIVVNVLFNRRTVEEKDQQ
ncbi:MAG: uracil-xanthine permease, partial [Clostridia bacterium]|nr:uracil-xanthine permease [Clostridia bacterium]